MLIPLLQSTQPIVVNVPGQSPLTPALIAVVASLPALVAAAVVWLKADAAKRAAEAAQKTADSNTDRANLHSTQIAAALMASNPQSVQAGNALSRLAAVAEETAAPAPPAKVPAATNPIGTPPTYRPRAIPPRKPTP